MQFTNTSIDEVIAASKAVMYDYRDPLFSKVDQEVCKDMRQESYYHLLTAFAKTYPMANFLELGTFTGVSSLAYLYGKPSNPFHTYDIGNYLKFLPAGFPVTTKIENAATADFSHLGKLDFIFVDISHNATDESLVMENLKKQGMLKECMLMFDDIHINSAMDKWWDEIDMGQSVKRDITKDGHATGTGILIFA